MKRSEMIKLIEENVNAFIESGKLSTQDAENLLIHMEIAGILPPPQVMTYEEFKTIEKYNITPHTGVHRWDKE